MKTAFAIGVSVFLSTQYARAADTNRMAWLSVLGSDVIIAGQMQVPSETIRDALKVPKHGLVPRAEWWVPIGLSDTQFLKDNTMENPVFLSLRRYWFEEETDAEIRKVFQKKAVNPYYYVKPLFEHWVPAFNEMQSLDQKKVVLCLRFCWHDPVGPTPLGYHIEELHPWSPSLHTNTVAEVARQQKILSAFKIGEQPHRATVLKHVEAAVNDGDPKAFLRIQQIGNEVIPTLVSLLGDQRRVRTRTGEMWFSDHDGSTFTVSNYDVSYGLRVALDYLADHGKEHHWFRTIGRSDDYWRLWWYYEGKAKYNKPSGADGN